VLWLLGDDGERHRLHQPFPVTFYAVGPAMRLRALRRTDQLALDDLFAADHTHLAAAAYAANALPFEAFLLAMLLEEHKEVLHLRRFVEAATGEPATLSAGSPGLRFDKVSQPC
jgi:hypothetical protein